MPQTTVFRWLDGRGWLVFSGRIHDDDGDVGDIRSLVLARASADGGVACVSLSGDPNRAENLLHDLEDVGAPSGYLIDVFSEDDETIQKQLSQAGVVVIDSATDAESARSALIGAPIDGIQEAYANGAMVLVEGYSMAAFGAWLVKNNGSLANGSEWLEGASLFTSASNIAAQAQSIFELEPGAVAVGINHGSALALGPDGEVQIWGRGQVGVAMGTNYDASNAVADDSYDEEE